VKAQLEGKTDTTQAEGAVSWLEFGRHLVEHKQSRKKNRAKVIYYKDLGKTADVPSTEPVQLTMF